MPSNPDARPARKDDRRFGARYLLRNTILAVLTAVAFWMAWTAEGSRRWVALAVFLGLIVSWIAADFVLFRRYQCPQCGTAVRKPTAVNRSPADPILYYCPRCNIEWDTRLRESGEL